MLPKNRVMSPKKFRQLQGVWERLSELFPWIDDIPDLAVVWDPPYMIWQITDVVPEFFNKTVLPLVKELERFGAKAAHHGFMPGVFYIRIPFTPFQTTKFRGWVTLRNSAFPAEDYAQSDSDFDYPYGNDDWDAYADNADLNESEFYENEFYTKKGW